jgi:hypothetical protein
MRLIQACYIDYATDVRGGPYEKGTRLTSEEIAALQGHIDREQVTIDAVSGESPYNAVLSCLTSRYLAELRPQPSD